MEKRCCTCPKNNCKQLLWNTCAFPKNLKQGLSQKSTSQDTYPGFSDIPAAGPLQVSSLVLHQRIFLLLELQFLV